MTVSGKNVIRLNARSARLTAFVIALSAFLIQVSCSGAEKGPEHNRLAVVTATGEGATVTPAANAGETLPARVGHILRSGDELQTNQGSIDLQTRGGNLIRLSSFTIVSIEKLIQDSSRATRLNMKRGILDAVINKADQDHEFQIITPTSIASVRGTKFRVETLEDSRPRVRVYEGSVSFSPNSETIAPEKYEVVVEGEEQAEFSKELHKAVQVSKTAKGKEVTPDPKSTISKKKEPLKAREKAMLLTMEPMDEALIENALEQISEPGSSKLSEASISSVSPETVEKIKTAREEQDDLAIKRIAELPGMKGIISEEEIQKRYKLLEIIHRKDGGVLSGAVVTQMGDTLVVHSTEGVSKMKKAEIDYVELKTK